MKPVLLALATLLAAALACNIDQRENTISNIDRKYRINARTILETLAQGNEDVFFEWQDLSEQELTSPQELSNWGQADYFRIANALHQFVWNEPLSEMNLFLMHFGLKCGETGNGFKYAQFLMFKVVQTPQDEIRIKHGIEIDQTNNYVEVWETEYSPVLSNWKPIDLSQVKISAEQALQIAEKNGGQEKRMAVNNECFMSAEISRDTIHYDGWIVAYSPSIFFDEIDPVTGEQHHGPQ